MTEHPITAHLYTEAPIVWIGDGRGKETGYWLDRIVHDLGADLKCFRLRKLLAERDEGEPNAYDVQVSAEPDKCECECKGYLRHRKCKHIAGLLHLLDEGKLP